MKVFIHSLVKTIYEGEVVVATLPAQGGQISILAGHIPLATALAAGVIHIKESEFSIKEFSIKRGFVEMSDDRLIVLAN